MGATGDTIVVTPFPGRAAPAKAALDAEAAIVARASGRAGLDVRIA